MTASVTKSKTATTEPDGERQDEPPTAESMDVDEQSNNHAT